MPGSTNPWASELKARKTSIRNSKSGNHPDPDPDPRPQPEKRDPNVTKFSEHTAAQKTPQCETGGVGSIREKERLAQEDEKVFEKGEKVFEKGEEIRTGKREIKFEETKGNRGEQETEVRPDRKDGLTSGPKRPSDKMAANLKSTMKTKSKPLPADDEETGKGNKFKAAETGNTESKGLPVEANEAGKGNKSKTLPVDAEETGNGSRSKDEETGNGNKSKALPVNAEETGKGIKTKPLPVKPLPVEADETGKGTNLYLDARNQLKRVVTRQISRPSVVKSDDDDDDDGLTPIDRLIRQGSFEKGAFI